MHNSQFERTMMVAILRGFAEEMRAQNESMNEAGSTVIKTFETMRDELNRSLREATADLEVIITRAEEAANKLLNDPSGEEKFTLQEMQALFDLRSRGGENGEYTGDERGRETSPGDPRDV